MYSFTPDKTESGPEEDVEEDQEEEEGKRKRRERGIRFSTVFMFREMLHLGLCLWESNLFMVLLLHTLSGTQTHMLTCFLVADDETKVVFADGKKGLKVEACALHKSALHTLTLHIHAHKYSHTNTL